MIEANQSVITDLSKLGKPGDKFVHDFFLPGTQLTFPQTTAAQIAKVDGVASVSSGLVLAAVHQSGTVPKIVAKIKAGGQQIQVNRQIPRPTAAEFAAMQKCLAEGGHHRRRATGWRREHGHRVAVATSGGLGGGGGAAGGGDRSAFAKCLPARLQRFRATITTPEQTLQQVVNPPQTNIKSSTLHDRRRRSDDAGHRRRHGLPWSRAAASSPRARARAPTRHCSRAPTRAGKA